MDFVAEVAAAIERAGMWSGLLAKLSVGLQASLVLSHAPIPPGSRVLLLSFFMPSVA